MPEKDRKNYQVRSHVFATLQEASAYAEEIRRRTRIIAAVTETRRKVTHNYKD